MSVSAVQKIVQAGSAKFGFINAPAELFKFFTQEQHALDLVRRGTVRVGTLHEFRATDGWDSVRGDAAEGEFAISLTSAQPETITSESAPWYLRPIIERFGMPILSHGGTVKAIPRHPDAYVYCTTAQPTASALAGYGRFVIQIFDAESFLRALTHHLTDVLAVAAREPHGFLAPCLYLDRSREVDSQTAMVEEPPLAFIKPPAKHEEREVRAIWHPVRPPPVPIITECRALTEFCRYLGATHA